MNSKYPRMNLRYASDEDENELSEIYLRICDTGDMDKFLFIRFYFYLVNYRVEHGINEDYPICTDEIWPYLNHCKTAFRKSVFNNDDSELQSLKKYILEIFEVENKKYLKRVNDEYFELLKKVPKSKATQIEHQIGYEYSQQEPEFGIEFNNVWMSLELIRLRTYANSLMSDTLREEKINRRNFLLGLFLGAVGTICSVVGLLPLIFKY